MLIKFIKENKIQTISYDESLVENKQDFIIDISKKLRIPLLMNHGGLYTVRTKLKKKKNLNFLINVIFFYLQINTQYIFILSIKIMLIQKNSNFLDLQGMMLSG